MMIRYALKPSDTSRKAVLDNDDDDDDDNDDVDDDDDDDDDVDDERASDHGRLRLKCLTAWPHTLASCACGQCKKPQGKS